MPGERTKALFVRKGSFAQRLSVLFVPNSVGTPIRGCKPKPPKILRRRLQLVRMDYASTWRQACRFNCVRIGPILAFLDALV